MECCCCVTYSTEVHYTETALYKRVRDAIDAENTAFFRQPAWKEGLEARQIRALFEYAVSRKSPPSIVSHLLRGNVKILVEQLGFWNVFSAALIAKTSQQDLIELLAHTPQDFVLARVRSGMQGKSVLHLCAQHGNVQWLRYFVEDLGYSHPDANACWKDSSGHGPLYYAAHYGQLDTAKYLVQACEQSPSQKGYRKSSYCPMDVAKGSIKEFFQKYHFLNYDPQKNPLQNANLSYKPKRCSDETAHRGLINETTPLLK